MKKIVIILPRGESIKNFVYSGITDKLRENFTVIFFSVVPNTEIRSYLESKCDEFYELQDTIHNSVLSKEMRKILQIAHIKNLNSVTGNLKMYRNDLTSTKSFKSKFIRKFRKAVASKFNNEDRLIKFSNFFIKINYKNSQVTDYERLLSSIQPDIVFNTSHSHNAPSLNLMYAVKKMNLKSAAFLFSWDNLTSQGRILPSYDVYFTWNHQIKKDLLKYYPQIKESNVYVTGTPQFDFHFNENFIESKEDLHKQLNIPLHKKIILYSTGMSYYTPKEYVHVKELNKLLKNIDEDLQLVVRIYAKDDNTEYYKFRETTDMCIPDHYWELNHLTPTIKDIKLFNSLLNYCSIGINVASTVSLDLAILDKPIINIAFNPLGENVYPNDYRKIYDFDHYKPIIESGAISLAKSEDELKEYLKLYLHNPKENEANRKKLTDDFFGLELKINREEKFLSVFKEILLND